MGFSLLKKVSRTLPYAESTTFYQAQPEYRTWAKRKEVWRYTKAHEFK